MKRVYGSVAVAVGVVLAGAATAADLSVTQTAPAEAGFTPTFTFSSTSELSYAFFSGSRAFPGATAQTVNRGSGNQVYLDTSYAMFGNPSELFKLEFLLKSGYVKSEQTTGGFTGRYTGSTDTVFSATTTYLGIDGIQPYVALNFNLPTGKSALYGYGGRARLDPDLVPVPTFGEGFNFGPTIGVNIPINPNLLLNLSGGMTLRESYLREGPFAGVSPIFQTTSKYTPGRLTSLSANLTYSDGGFNGQASASYSSETTAYDRNTATTRSGNRFTFSLATSYAFTEYLTAAFNGTASFAKPNYGVHPDVAVPVSALFPDGVVSYPNGVLTQEDRNSNNKTLQGKISVTYVVTTGFSVTPFVGILYRDKNSYDPVQNIFIPAKTRYSFGSTASYALTERIALTGRFEHIRTFERGSPNKFDPLLEAFNPGFGFTPGSSTVPLTYYGWQFAAGASFTF